MKPLLDLEAVRKSAIRHAWVCQNAFDNDRRQPREHFQHGGAFGLWANRDQEGIQLGPFELSHSTREVPESWSDEEKIHVSLMPGRHHDTFFETKKYLGNFW